MGFAFREVWPEDDCFGAASSTPEDELLLLREIFFTELGRGKLYIFVFSYSYYVAIVGASNVGTFQAMYHLYIATFVYAIAVSKHFISLNNNKTKIHTP